MTSTESPPPGDDHSEPSKHPSERISTPTTSSPSPSSSQQLPNQSNPAPPSLISSDPPKPPNDTPTPKSLDSNEDGDGDDDIPWYIPRSVKVSYCNKPINKLINRCIAMCFRMAFLAVQFIRKIAKVVLKDIPTPVIATIISATATVMVTRIKAGQDSRQAEDSRNETRAQSKMESENQLRKSYKDLTLPLLKASSKLADRLYQMIDADITMIEDEKVKDDIRGSESSLYSAYLVGKYFSAVQMMSYEHPLFDYGFPAADRILYNIVGRVQGLFCANDKLFTKLQSTEQYFKSDSEPLKSGLFKITPKTQVTLGQLLFETQWVMQKNKFPFVEANKTKASSVRSILSFLEFSRIYDMDDTMHKWYQPIVNDFKKLEAMSGSIEKTKDRRNDMIGARVFFVQSALCDLIDFFDPFPHTRVIPSFRRRRLQIASFGSGIAQRRPLSLQKVFDELSLLRDNRSLGDDPLPRLKLPYEIEVYISSEQSEILNQWNKKLAKIGKCKSPSAESHQVLLILNEMKLSYKTIAIALHAKPQWYYMLHPDSKTPCLYHDGNVLDNIAYIIPYLNVKFPKHKQLISIDHLNLRPSVQSLSKFHKCFLRWLITNNDHNKGELEKELIYLNRIVAMVVKSYNSKNCFFFGGRKFSHEDIEIIPYLHHVDVVGQALKDWRIPAECEVLRKYLEMARNMESFKVTVPDNEYIIERYGTQLETESLINDRVSDLLD